MKWGDERKLLPWKPLPSWLSEVYYVAMCDFSACGLSAVKTYRAIGAMLGFFFLLELPSGTSKDAQCDNYNVDIVINNDTGHFSNIYC